MIYYIRKLEISTVKLLVEADSEEQAFEKVEEFIKDDSGSGELYRSQMDQNTRFDTIASCLKFRDIKDYEETCKQSGIENLYPHDFEIISTKSESETK